MTDCNRLSDRMPAVAHGNAAWNAEDARHLAACEACRFEWELVRQTAALGGAKTVPPLNPDAVTDAVLQRLRAPEPTTAPEIRRRRGWVAAIVAAAACLTLLLWNRSQMTPGGESGQEIVAAEPVESTLVNGERLELPVPELDDLRADELELIMGELDEPFQADQLLESPSWGDLEREAIERGFSMVEG